MSALQRGEATDRGGEQPGKVLFRIGGLEIVTLAPDAILLVP